MDLCKTITEFTGNTLFCGQSTPAGVINFSWDPAYVLLSVLICSVYSGIACEMYSKSRVSGKAIHSTVLKTGSIFGLGIFSMHFVGMYALVEPGPMLYDLTITLFSLWVAITGTCLTLLLLYLNRSLKMAAVLFGVTICSMHYAGMLSILTNPYNMHHRGELLIVAVVYSVSASYISLHYFLSYLKQNNQLGLLKTAVAMGITISGMHYLAMIAMELTPVVQSKTAIHGNMLSRDSIIFSTVLMLLFTIVVYVRDSFKAEEQLKRKKNELEASNRSINEAIVKLKATQNQLVESEKMASMGKMISGIAHEINTPVGICITGTTYLEEQANELLNDFKNGNLTRARFERFMHDHSDSSQLVMENLNKAASLIQSFRHASAEQGPDHVHSFLIGEHIQDIISDQRNKLEDSHFHIELECEPDFEVNTYSNALIIIINQLIENSLIHGFEGRDDGLMRLTAVKSDGAVVLRYEDDGCGMDQESIEQAFSPFYTTKRSEGFSGLGMHVIYNQVTQMLQGILQCSSGPDQGLHIEIRFPVRITEHSAKNISAENR